MKKATTKAKRDTIRPHSKVEVEPGETQTLVATFDESDHVARFACLIEGHHEAGMHGDFKSSG